MEGIRWKTIFLVLFLVLPGCAGDSDDDDDDNGSPTPGEETPTPDPDPDPDPDPEPRPGDEIELEASMNFSDGSDGRDPGDFATVDDEFEIEFDGSVRIPVQIDVSEGNSGTGWTGLTIGQRKFCYQGNASDDATPDGNAYELKNEAITLEVPCVPAGFENPDPVVAVVDETEVKLAIETPGCLYEEEACQDTTVEATVTVESVEDD